MPIQSPLKIMGISAAARAVGCSEGTLRQLDRRGIVHPLRDSGGRRQFGDDDVTAARAYLAGLRPTVGR